MVFIKKKIVKTESVPAIFVEYKVEYKSSGFPLNWISDTRIKVKSYFPY